MTIAKGTGPFGLGLVAATLMAGCVVNAPGSDTDDGRTMEPLGDGVVEVSWLVGASGCEANGITVVEIAIGDTVSEVACDIGTTRLQVEEGDYTLVATGLDADGIARFEAMEALVSVFADETTQLPTLVLSALPADLTLYWSFGGKLCGRAGVDNVQVAIFDNEELIAPFPQVVDCDPGVATFEGISAGTYSVALRGLDENDQAIFEAVEDIELFRGELAEFDFLLLPIDDPKGQP